MPPNHTLHAQHIVYSQCTTTCSHNIRQHYVLCTMYVKHAQAYPFIHSLITLTTLPSYSICSIETVNRHKTTIHTELDASYVHLACSIAFIFLQSHNVLLSLSLSPSLSCSLSISLLSFFSLVERKEQWKKEEYERKKNTPDPSIPAGHTQMPEKDRQETLLSLKESTA